MLVVGWETEVVDDDAMPVVVVAGGGSTRFGGDKLVADLGGHTVLDRLLDDLPPAWPVVVVGPRREVRRSGVRWTREEPPGGGPLAAAAAGMALVEGPVVGVVAGDMPFAGPVLAQLRSVLLSSGTDAAVAVDDDGHANPLLAVYRTAAVRRLLPGPVTGGRAKRLLELEHERVPVPGRRSRDVDTPEDLERLRRRR